MKMEDFVEDEIVKEVVRNVDEVVRMLVWKNC